MTGSAGALARGFASKVEIPPTAVGGSFKSGLHQAPLMMKKFHQRQLVDCSSPTY
jgi:hypothetical protein